VEKLRHRSSRSEPGLAHGGRGEVHGEPDLRGSEKIGKQRVVAERFFEEVRLQRAPHAVRTPAAANTEMNRSFLLRDERIEIPRGFVSARDLAPRPRSHLVSEPSVRSDPPSRFQQPEPRFRAVPDTNE
jgi:hypothetical protein